MKLERLQSFDDRVMFASIRITLFHISFDPALRITVEEALAHPYLSAYHDEDDEPVHHQHYDFSFESVEAKDDMKKLIAQEVMSFKASKQAMLQPQLSPGANLRRKDR
jgi:mitogen-activated protein kinase 7